MSNSETTQIETLQEQILRLTAKWQPPLSPAVKAAFRAMPRHAFVQYFLRDGKEVVVTPENLSQHLTTIYANGVLPLVEDRGSGRWSTISQPTLVLGMLNQLDLAEGQRVFELGAGSGWNAAMIGQIVGPNGRVCTVEIIPEIAEGARRAIAARGLANVEVITGDGGDGFAAGAPYDRAVFTAGSYDLPRAFHEQVRVGGLLLLVVKVEGGGDQLMLLEKGEDSFVSKRGLLCAFVPMVGSHMYAAAHPGLLSAIPGWPELERQEINRRPFWWGGSPESAIWAATGVRSFLSVAEPKFRVFREDAKDALNPQHWFCGVFDEQAQSLVIARNGMLVSYGNAVACDRLLMRLHQWIDLGMPTMGSMNLRIYPAGVEVQAGVQQWVVKRSESTFVWSLKAAREEPS